MGNELYGVPIEQVQEVVPLTPISEPPNSPPYTEGVTILRDVVHVLHNLRTRLGLERKEFDSKTKIIIPIDKTLDLSLMKLMKLST